VIRPIAVFIVSVLFSIHAYTDSDSFLNWTDQYCLGIGKAMTAKGRVGGFYWGVRLRHTERSYNYKLRATWFTPDVIWASARLEQRRNRLTSEQTRALVSEAESVGDTVILVEIDPSQGSGVIPLEWQAYLQPKGLKEDDEGAVSGIQLPALRKVKALAGVTQRDYAYDQFWLVFPLTKEKVPVFSDAHKQAELIVIIYDREGRVEWTIPSSIHQRTSELLNQRNLNSSQ
jgi:hypothetical protein